MAEPDNLNLREQVLRIDQLIAKIEHTRADHLRIIAEHDRKRQGPLTRQICYQPWLAAFSGLTAGAALFAAGAAFAKILGL